MEHVMHSGLLIPLTAVQSGRSVILRRICAGNGLISQLAAMGLIPGVTVDVRRNDCTGPVVLALRGGRVMLGRGMASKMLVKDGN